MKKRIIEYVAAIVIGAMIPIILLQFVILNMVIPSNSMCNQINVGDRLFGNKLAYCISKPKRFDVVVFKYPVDPSVLYIKRIIGLPGEHVDIENGKIYIDGNDEPLQEDYLPEAWIDLNTDLHYDVPQDEYFVLGDNRNYSADSRYWASEAFDAGLGASIAECDKYMYLPADDIVAKAVIEYYPSVNVIK